MKKQPGYFGADLRNFDVTTSKGGGILVDRELQIRHYHREDFLFSSAGASAQNNWGWGDNVGATAQNNWGWGDNLGATVHLQNDWGSKNNLFRLNPNSFKRGGL